ncbi:MAG: hypothetical protein V1911_02410 [Candidatus Micrarchaeota archaeon]
MIIGIDSSFDKTFTGIAVGLKVNVAKLYSEISKIALKRGIKNIHWRKMSLKERKFFDSSFCPLLADSNVSFWIIKHKRPDFTGKKEYYLDAVPSEIAYMLERSLRRRYGSALIECDDDYNVKGIENSTKVFLRKLFKQLGFRLTGRPVGLFERGGAVKTIVPRFIDGIERNLELEAKTADYRDSGAVQLADLALGLYNFDQKKYRKIFRVYEL